MTGASYNQIGWRIIKRNAIYLLFVLLDGGEEMKSFIILYIIALIYRIRLANCENKKIILLKPWDTENSKISFPRQRRDIETWIHIEPVSAFVCFNLWTVYCRSFVGWCNKRRRSALCHLMWSFVSSFLFAGNRHLPINILAAWMSERRRRAKRLYYCVWIICLAYFISSVSNLPTMIVRQSVGWRSQL